MTLRDDIAALNAPKARLTPSLDRGVDRGSIVTHETTDDHVDWDTIFRHWNLDPDAWEVVEDTIRVNAWEGPSQDGPRIYRQYKAEVRRKGRWADVDPLLARVAKFKAKAAGGSSSDSPAYSFVTMWADWQVGPRPDEFVERFETSLANVARLAKRSKASHLAVLFGGDMREGAGGNYPSQEFHAQLDNTEQGRLVRTCEAKVLATLAPLFSSTTAAAVAGNHGRKGSEVRTRRSDNADLDDFEHMAEVLTAEGSTEACQISFVVPDKDDTGVLLDCSGTIILLAHGDEKRGSADALRGWWKDTSFTGVNGAQHAHILITGHRHHLRVEEMAAGRCLMVAPTLGPESHWFAQGGGGTSLPGTLTFTAGGGRFWDLEVA